MSEFKFEKQTKPELSFGVWLVSSIMALAVAGAVIYGHWIFVDWVLAW